GPIATSTGACGTPARCSTWTTTDAPRRTPVTRSCGARSAERRAMDDWARPDPDRPVEESRIEGPLAGDANAAPGTDDDGRPTPNWRKITAISALAGIA